MFLPLEDLVAINIKPDLRSRVHIILSPDSKQVTSIVHNLISITIF